MTPTAKSPTLAKSAAAGSGAGAPSVPDADRLDAAIAELGLGARAWSHLTLGQRARLLERLHATTAANAEEWADTAALSKGLEPGHRAARRGVARWALRDAGRARRVPQEPGGSREGCQPAEGREDGCRPRRPSAGAHLPARRDRRAAAVGLLRRSLVRTRESPTRQARASAGLGQLNPTQQRRHRPGPRRRQRHLDSRPRRAVRTPRLQPRRDPQGQPDPGRAGSGLRAGAGTADRGGLPAHRPRRRRGRRVPDRPRRHRPRPHHRRRPDVRCDRLGHGRRRRPGAAARVARS